MLLVVIWENAKLQKMLTQISLKIPFGIFANMSGMKQACYRKK